MIIASIRIAPFSAGGVNRRRSSSSSTKDEILAGWCFNFVLSERRAASVSFHEFRSVFDVPVLCRVAAVVFVFLACFCITDVGVGVAIFDSNVLTRALRKMTRVASADFAGREEIVDVVVVVAAEDGGVAGDGACFLRPLTISVAQVRLAVVCFCWRIN